MKLIVGLGNPGLEYMNTRHNIGYMYLDYILGKVDFKLNKKFNSLQYECEIESVKCLFIKPLLYMNLSGEVVKKYVDYYKISLDDVLIIQDDLDMDIGKYKLMFNHGDGGHNGIKNIISNLGSRSFLRLKIGISKSSIDAREYVLGKFSKDELLKLDDTFLKLKEFLTDYVSMDKDILMGKYNSRDI